ncbi:hypothetical protein FB451DRAFT_1193029 [Mycena latifolia]|nr:hypothetical protein FB451DRAFT_1193029 [Mycena latifolia]
MTRKDDNLDRQRGVLTGNDFWSRADAFIAKRISGRSTAPTPIGESSTLILPYACVFGDFPATKPRARIPASRSIEIACATTASCTAVPLRATCFSLHFWLALSFGGLVLALGSVPLPTATESDPPRGITRTSQLVPSPRLIRDAPQSNQCTQTILSTTGHLSITKTEVPVGCDNDRCTESVIIQIPVPPALTLIPHSRGIVRQVYQYIDIPYIGRVGNGITDKNKNKFGGRNINYSAHDILAIRFELHQHSAADHLHHEAASLLAILGPILFMLRRRRLRRNQRDAQFLVDPEASAASDSETSGLTPHPLSPSPSASTTASDTSTAKKALLRRADLEQQVHQMQAEMAELQRIARQVNAPSPAPESAREPEPPTTQQLDLLQLRARIGELESQREFVWMEDAPPGYQLDGSG